MALTTTDLDRLNVSAPGAVIHNPDVTTAGSPGKSVHRPLCKSPIPVPDVHGFLEDISCGVPSTPDQLWGMSVPPPGCAPSILARLGIAGMKTIEPVILGGLIGGEPILLIGPHGTGKSYMLCRISRALGLEWRHYNASLLNFDDLVGYPMPDERGNLRYVETSSSIWGAGTVFIDEISRCRPDLQNKLFPIIHERRVQGLLLDKLVYRWSAMNPPDTGEVSEGDDDGDDEPLAYRGSEPLDPALADRFAFVVEMPPWETFSEVDRESVITAVDGPVDDGAAADLRSIIQSGRSLLPALREELEENLSAYVRIVAALLARASIDLSPRRCGMLLRNILAVHAAAVVTQADAALSTSALTALRYSLPQLAWGAAVRHTPVVGSHRAAWDACRFEPDDPRRMLVLEKDPVRRILLATSTVSLGVDDFSSVVADALAELPPGARHAVATSLFESKSASRLVTAVAEQCARLHAETRVPQDFSTVIKGGSLEHECWKHIESRLARFNRKDPDSLLAANLVVSHYRSGELTTGKEADALLDHWTGTRRVLRGIRS